MNKFNRYTGIAILTTVLGACATSSEPDYSSVGTLPPLEVPPDLTSVKTDRSYDLPSAVEQSEAQKKAAVVPMVGDTNSVIPVFESARIVRAGTQRWAVVKSKPEPLWVSMRSFLQKLGWSIDKENPQTGIMETEWKETTSLIKKGGFLSFVNNALGSTGLKDKFRFRLERGTSAGETELFVTHQMLEEVIVSGGGTEVVETRWQPRASDPEREAEMLTIFLRYLESGRIDKKKPDAKVAAIPSRTRLGKDKDGYPVIQTADSLDLTWRRLGVALDRAGFLVQDRDKTRSTYFVFKSLKKTRKKGMFGGLFGGEDEQAKEYFQVRTAASGGNVFITMLDANGERLDNDDARKLLEQLDQKLQY